MTTQSLIQSRRPSPQAISGVCISILMAVVFACSNVASVLVCSAHAALTITYSTTALAVTVTGGTGDVADNIPLPATGGTGTTMHIKLNQVKVTYDTNQGDGSTVPSAVTVGNVAKTEVYLNPSTAIGSLKPDADPTRDGYTFEGWYNGATLASSTSAGLATYNVGATNLTLTAHWKPKPKTLTLNVTPNGTNANDIVTAVTVKGNYTNNSGTTSEKTLTWSKSNNSPTETFDFDATLTATVSVKSGYAPAWTQTMKPFSGSDEVTNKTDSSFTVRYTGDALTLAVTATPSAAYINFNKNLPSGKTDSDLTGFPANLTGATDDPTSSKGWTWPAGDNAPALTGYDFQGWYKNNAACTGTAATGFDANMAAGTSTYYAKWTKKERDLTVNMGQGVTAATLTYGSTTVNLTEADPSTTVTLPYETSFTVSITTLSSGYNKKIIYKVNEGGTYHQQSYDETSHTFTMPENAVSITLKGVGDEVDIRFDANAGDDKTVSGIPAGIKGRVGQTIDATFPTTKSGSTFSDAVPTRNGYKFAGWLDADTNTEIAEYKYPANFPAGGKTYKASWTAGTTKAKFDYNYKEKKEGEEEETDKGTFYPASGATSVGATTGSTTFPTGFWPATDPTRPGYAFAGWYTYAAGGELVKANAATAAAITKVPAGKPAGDDFEVTFYAHWKEIEAAPSLNTNTASSDGNYNVPTSGDGTKMYVKLSTHPVNFYTGYGTENGGKGALFATAANVGYNQTTSWPTLVPSRTGWTFDKWSAISGSSDYKADWKDVEKHKLDTKIDSDEFSVDVSLTPSVTNTNKVPVGTAVRYSIRPKDDGEFGGWVNPPAGAVTGEDTTTHPGQVWYTLEFDMPNEDVTIGAYLDEGIVKHKVTFVVTNKPAGADHPAPDNKVADKGQPKWPVTEGDGAYTRTGYTLDGWYKDEACTTANKWNAASDKITEDKTLYAKWVIDIKTITLKENFKDNESVIKLDGDTASDRSSTIYQWTGKGFYTSVPNDGTEPADADEIKPDGSSDNLPVFDNTGRGYTFAGYTHTAGTPAATTDIADADGKILVSSDYFADNAELNAKWSVRSDLEYKVKYVEDGETTALVTQTVKNATFGSKPEIVPITPAQTKDEEGATKDQLDLYGYQFEGGKTAEQMKRTDVQITGVGTPTEVTFTMYRRTFEVTFTLGDAAKDLSDQTHKEAFAKQEVSYQSTATKPDYDPDKKDGTEYAKYTFGGWYVNNGSGIVLDGDNKPTNKKWAFTSEKDPEPVEGPVNLIGFWSERTQVDYNVSVHWQKADDASSYDVETTTMNDKFHEDEMEISASDFSHTGFDYNSGKPNVLKITLDKAKSLAENTLHIYFDRKRNNINYYVGPDAKVGSDAEEDGVVQTSYVYEASGTYTLPTGTGEGAVHRPGYAFSGWCTDTAGTDAGSGFDKNSLADKTFFAKWTAIVNVDVPATVGFSATYENGSVTVKNSADQTAAATATFKSFTPKALAVTRVQDVLESGSDRESVLTGTLSDILVKMKQGTNSEFSFGLGSASGTDDYTGKLFDIAAATAAQIEPATGTATGNPTTVNYNVDFDTWAQNGGSISTEDTFTLARLKYFVRLDNATFVINNSGQDPTTVTPKTDKTGALDDEVLNKNL